jgi:hypothetical protein
MPYPSSAKSGRPSHPAQAVQLSGDADKILRNQSSYTEYALSVRSKVNTVMEAGYEAMTENARRGKQLYDLCQMAAVLRYQVEASTEGSVTEVRAKDLAPPSGSLSGVKSSDKYYEYIQETLQEVKTHLITLHINEKRSRKLLNEVIGTVEQPDPNTIESIDTSGNPWENIDMIHRVIKELDDEDE